MSAFTPPGLSWLLLPTCPSHLGVRGWGCWALAWSRGTGVRLGSRLTSSLTLDKYFSLVISSAVCRVVVGVLEILFKVSSAADISFQEPGILRDSCLFFKGGNCQPCFQRATRILTRTTVCLSYFDLSTMFTQRGAFSTYVPLWNCKDVPSREKFVSVYDLLSSVWKCLHINFVCLQTIKLSLQVFDFKKLSFWQT